MAVDEVCDAAKSIAHHNANAVLLVMLPVCHASVDKLTIVKKRREVEDRLMGRLAWHASRLDFIQRQMDTTDLSLGFTQSEHGGDKRARAQP